MSSPRLAALFGFSVLTLLGGCIPGGPGDDDTAGDDDDATADDDDSSPPDYVTLSGEITAIDEDSGVTLTAEEYAARAGRIVLYVVADPADLGTPVGKVVMTGPGSWSVDLIGPVPTVYVLAIADDGDTIIGSLDLRREHLANPVTPGETDTTGLDVVFELPAGWGTGGGGGDDDDDDDDDDDSVDNETRLSGMVVVNGLDPAAIMVTANSEDGTQGPYGHVLLSDGPGDFAVDLPNGLGSTSLLAYLDRDSNGLFEPSDALGAPVGNPYILGIGDVEGITISIPTAGVGGPQPPGYVTVLGSVFWDDWSNETIHLYASRGGTTGLQYAGAVVHQTGDFALRVPPNTSDLLIWGIVDSDLNGNLDPAVDAFDSFGPISVGGGDYVGVTLDLHDEPQPGSISGSVVWPSGTTGPDDVLRVLLFTSPTFQGAPVATRFFEPPALPQAFTFTDVAPGVYYISASIDLGGDNGGGPPAANEPQGAAGGFFEIIDGDDVSGAEVVLSIGPGGP